MKLFNKVMLPVILMSSVCFADKIKLLEKNEEALQARVDLVQNAKQDILVEYYEMGSDRFSFAGLALLKEAAERGVRVKILVDNMHNSLSKAEMAAALGISSTTKASKNIEIRLFNSIRSLNLFHQTYRNHDKLLNVDGKYMIVGGRNAAESYFGHSETVNFKDADALVQGSSAQISFNYFMDLWNSNPEVSKLDLYEFSKEKIDSFCGFEVDSVGCDMRRTQVNSEIDAALAKITKAGEKFSQGGGWVHTKSLVELLSDVEEVGEIYFAFNDPKRPMKNVDLKLAKQIMDNLLSDARESITITTPYLYPTEDELAALKILANRGVHIKIITNSLQSTDTPLVHAALISIKSRLAAMGIELYLYKGPEVLHAKGAVIDNKISFIGSFNFDRRSALINREIGIKVGSINGMGSAFTKEFMQFINEDLINNSVLAIKNGIEYDLTAFDSNVSEKKRNDFEKNKILVPLLKNQI